MKLANLFALLILCAITFYSCKDENPAAPVYESVATGTLQANVDGALFTSTNVQTSQFDPELIKINASATTEGISLIFTDWQIGQYAIGGNNNDNSIEYSSVSSQQGAVNFEIFTSKDKTNATGTINILAVDQVNKTLSGTFDAVLVNQDDASISFTIEDGVFNQVAY